MLGVDTVQPQIAMLFFLRHLLSSDELEKADEIKKEGIKDSVFCIHNELDKVNTS